MANRYWVGTTGNWNDSANWSDTTGGSGGFDVPNFADDVFFDANSGSGTVTVDEDAFCDDLNFTGFTGTFTGSQPIDCYGSLTVAAGMTISYSGTITFKATSSGKTTTLNGKTLACTFNFDGVGGGWTLQDAVNLGSRNFAITAGTVDLNGQTVTCSTMLTSGSATRVLTCGAATINVGGWGFSSVTNFTFNANTSTVNFSPSGSAAFNGGGFTYNVVNFTSTTSSSNTISGTNTFGTLSITGGANKTQGVTVAANQTISGTLTIAGNSLTNRLLVRSNVTGTPVTITAATTTLSNVDFMDITGAGAGSWSGTSVGNALGNSGITFTTPVTRYAVAAGNWSNTATWSSTSGGAGGSSVPLCHDTVILDASSGAGTYTADMPRLGASITCTGFTRTLTTSTAASIYGSLTLGSGMTLTASTQTYTLRGRSSHTITSAGKTWAKQIRMDAPGGTYTLQDDLESTVGLNFINGTFDANDHNVTSYSYDLYNDVITMGSGTWEVTGEYFYDYSTTTNSETSTVLFSGTSTLNREFVGDGKTYNKLEFTGNTSITYEILSNSTLTTLSSSNTVAHTILFSSGTTQTITNWDVSGTAGNVVTLNSTTTGTFTLTKAGGGDVSADYLNIQHCVATPSYAWYAGVSSTNNQSTPTAGSGWIFSLPIPDVTTQAVSAITDTTATGNGTIVDGGSSTVTKRGFVVDTMPHANPGNVAPGSSGYSLEFSDTGTYTTGAYTKAMTGLTAGTVYFVRAFAQNTSGYHYGDQVMFNTDGLTISLITNSVTNSSSIVNQTTASSGIINQTTTSVTVNN